MKPVNKSSNPKAAAKNEAVPAATLPKKPSTSGKPVRKRPALPSLPPPPCQLEKDVTHVEIATRCFIYVSEGRPAGREMQHGLEAEAQLRGR